ncbi:MULTISPECIES: NAD-glutamate dehydrogenase [Nocardia]|uniref:NAD-glutamate dehydrogenase n=1 Tax=Nocardia TaxID=1817 RepID=UPI000BF1166D|nr:MULTISPECIES: NAD-glutamate dehydrogenase [Nocardia]MBF6186221.1 NAD-glutamate dehydrogenase [Nocardia farcinica]MBF6313476.1 NAD-glutamate dehydrogenase [Nocardia farcinica]MBF6409052.1 NAD-glutamate dehydrogenase [Nocardia farcinica]PEH79526.1 NAD-glutamate dehydrogenase [Nocardia sp. FDAARGOS_372]UEX24089.1 NAD-glutamate dehydrogenase [Nocardia farcinica]
MTVSSELSGAAWAAGLPQSLRDGLATLERAYFRHVDADDVDSAVTGVSQIFRRHLELGGTRSPGRARIRVYHPDDECGLGAAVQVVTDDMPLLVESVTASLNRQGASVREVIHPIFEVDRDDDGRLLAAAPHEVDGKPAGTLRESWMHVQLHPSTDRAVLERIEQSLAAVVEDVRQVIGDREAIERAQSRLADELDRLAAAPEPPFPVEDLADTAALLRWLAGGHFTVLGFARYRIHSVGGHTVSEPVEGTCLGVLRPDVGTDFRVPVNGIDRPLLMLTQGLVPATVHRSVYPYFVGVADVDAAGTIVGEHLFIGVFTVTAVHENVLDIPVIQRRVRTAIEKSGFDLESYSGQAMLEVIQSFPRTELFSADAETMRRTAEAVLNVGLRRQVRLFLRADTYGRFVACLVYLPRDRYTTQVRLRMQDILVRELDGESIDYSARVSESELASVYFTVRMRDTHTGGPDRAAILSYTADENRRRIERLLAEASHTWADHLNDEVNASSMLDPAVVQRYAGAFPEAYKQDFSPNRALRDIARLERLAAGAIDQHLYRSPDAEPGSWRFTLYIGGAGISLSQVLPLLQSLGVEVVDERPYRVALDAECWIYDFGLLARPDLLRTALDRDLDAELLESVTADTGHGLRDRFTEAFAAMWYGRAEADGLNELVLRARLSWRAVSMLRTYAKYLQQAGFPYSQANIARVLLAYPDIAGLLVDLFAARFDPDTVSAERATELEAAVRERIDRVVSLDADRILRAILGLIKATLRTNYYMLDDAGVSRDYVSIKVEPREIAELPKPKPQFEIFVYSPRVEGVHLRFGPVARGGLRWSDRLEDFRTEILGLVKAQAVKNAVIVPVGAKGGFVVKQPPQSTGDPAADRQALSAEGVACYRTFISGLLDLTDNVDLASGAVVPPARVVRRDGDDTYLVVAADKGTATFSDIANDVARSYGFWLGDAFASGGSAGYDHKAMGITARGAWESVKRHFREMGIDTQSEDFTVVGIGDMSGDVFGNGMLLSEHIRLVAAFDHRHIFLDPDPDAARSYRERQRLFALPRSSWADYDTSLISAGGGVWDRTVKSVPISPQARAALGLPDDVVSLAPPELVRAILLAPVQLLWNGGIGTYIKATDETNAEVGDKSNDPVRVNGKDLRVRVIGEGGNLGATARGRIEFCRNGGKMNTDALDNSAGVDCSDHEVNIKVLLDGVVSAGLLPAAERNPLLASMTDEVADMVLRDNVSQNFLMGISRFEAPRMTNVNMRLITDLEQRRGLDRELEALPSNAELKRRRDNGEGLVSPELANLMAHVKLSLKADLLDSDLPDQGYFAARLPEYFPTPLRTRFGGAIKKHRLRREIVTTMIVNEMVDYGGISYAFRLNEESGASTTDAVRAFAAAGAIFDLPAMWERIRSADIPVAVRDELELETKRTLDRASRWLLNNRPQPIAVGAEINRYGDGVRELAPKVPTWLRGHHVATLTDQSAELVARGAPLELATEVFGLLNLFPLLDILDIADITDRDGDEVGALYYALNDHLKIDWLLQAVTHLERGDRWHALARLAVRDDMYGSLRSLTLDVLSAGDPEETADEKIAYWESKNQSRLGRARAALAELFESGAHDLASLSVASRQVRSMVSGVGAQSPGA